MNVQVGSIPAPFVAVASANDLQNDNNLTEAPQSLAAVKNPLLIFVLMALFLGAATGIALGLAL